MSQKPCLPTPRKRKRSQQSSQCNVDFDDIQGMDASEYLFRVMQQADRIPEVMVADTTDPATQSSADDSQSKTLETTTVKTRNHTGSKFAPIEGSAASLHYLISHRTTLQPPPSAAHTASREWVDYVLENFSRLRDYLTQCRTAGVGGREHRRQPVPALKDRAGWHLFCVGPDEADGNVGSYFQDDDDDARMTGSSTKREDDDSDEAAVQETIIIPAWKQNVPVDGYTPTVSLLSQMDQVMVRRVLGHLIHFVTVDTSGWSWTRQRSAWVYGLLARLERPIHRDEAAVLYSLLKHLSMCRANASPTTDASLMAYLNLLMVLVGIYFEQGGGYEAVMGSDFLENGEIREGAI